MAHRAALANITNMEMENAKHGTFGGNKLLNNKENVVEQVSKQRVHTECFVEKDEPMDIESPSHVTSLRSTGGGPSTV